MSDRHDAYLAGLRQLSGLLDGEDQILADSLLQQLLENIDDTKRGDMERLRHDRSVIIETADRLTRRTQSICFLEFCGIIANSSNIFQPEELDEIHQNIIRDYITSACYYATSLHKILQNISLLFKSDGDIWPKQCQESINALQQLQQPQLPVNFPSSLFEPNLFSLSEKVRGLIESIDDFSPFGRGNSLRARNLRHQVRQKLQDFPQSLRTVIEEINLSGALLKPPHICLSLMSDLENITTIEH